MYRGAAVALVLFFLLSVSSKAIECPPQHVVEPPVSSVPVFTPETPTLDSSTFRGLRLGFSREEALSAVLRLGFLIAPTGFPIPPTWAVSGRHIALCRGDYVVGSLRFDENDQLVTLELRPAFFDVNQVALREFADQIFEHYRVRPVVNDDVCSSDMTCFRGTTIKGENFLIVRIGGEVRLHVSR
jgi:hypothetical protein